MRAPVNDTIIRARREPGSDGVPFPRAKLPPLFAALLPKGQCGGTSKAKSRSGENLHERFEIERIGDQKTRALDGACTNRSQGFFGRLRHAEIGIHHHIAGAYLLRYAQESSWREDNRRVANGDQVNRVAALAMKRGKSVDFTGYWQRHVATS